MDEKFINFLHFCLIQPFVASQQEEGERGEDN